MTSTQTNRKITSSLRQQPFVNAISATIVALAIGACGKGGSSESQNNSSPTTGGSTSSLPKQNTVPGLGHACATNADCPSNAACYQLTKVCTTPCTADVNCGPDGPGYGLCEYTSLYSICIGLGCPPGIFCSVRCNTDLACPDGTACNVAYGLCSATITASGSGGATGAGGTSSLGGATGAGGTSSLGGATGAGGTSGGIGGVVGTGGTRSIGSTTASFCGDGIVQASMGEKCDDKNSLYPGCSATCQLEPGFQCPFAGAPCVPVCGDGILVLPAEQCDPGMKIPNVAQACNSDCTVKPNWICNATSCHQAVCGDGVVEGTEGCDPSPHNNDLGDGCTPLCMAEPACPSGTASNPGGPCITKCGDGLLLGTEQCDDGNAVSGDGCSSTCQIEPGFTCTQSLDSTMVVPVVVRDFDAGGDFEKGSSFAAGLNYANQGLLQSYLNPGGTKPGLKPVLVSPTGVYNGNVGQDSGIASATSFAQFYDDAAPAAGNAYHATLATTLTLYPNTAGTTYMNRFGVNGDSLTSAQYIRMSDPAAHICGNVGTEDHDAMGNPIPCTFCPNDSNLATPQCDPAPQATDCQTIPGMAQCVQSGGQWHGIWPLAAYDGNPMWFPADSLTPYSPSSTVQISGNYDSTLPMDPSGPQHNFSFTTEVRFWFTYDSSITYDLTFVGNDDVWVFVNKRLAVDLGGIHSDVQGELTFGGTGATTVTVTPTNATAPLPAITTHPNLGLQRGNVYEVAVFQAERQTPVSSYLLSLTGFNVAHGVCKPVCGGTNPALSPGEQCDNGTVGNCDPTTTDCYNKCTTSCKLGPHCGDGIVQNVSGEQCEPTSSNDPNCTADCKLPG